MSSLAQHQKYVRDQVQSATPQKLIIMLYDKAIKCLEDAKKQKDDKNPYHFTNNITKAEQILAELMGALKPEIAPELVFNLTKLYEFMYQHLVKAFDEKSLEKIEHVLTLLRDLRQTWLDAIEKAKNEEPFVLPENGPSAKAKERPSFTLQA